MSIKPLHVRKLIIGSGVPAIAVPIVGDSKHSILEQARTVKASCADMVEWRADLLKDLTAQHLTSIAVELRELLGELPLLFTIRTAQEGGNAVMDDGVYYSLNCALAASGTVDIVDVEAISHAGASGLIRELHEKNALVLGSSHDFCATPEKDAIINRLRYIQELGCDILK